MPLSDRQVNCRPHSRHTTWELGRSGAGDKDRVAFRMYAIHPSFDATLG